MQRPAPIILPWPPASLSGHNDGHWSGKSGTVKRHRAKAQDVTTKAAVAVPEEGDLHLHIRFVPPDRRSDRVNFPNRMKPYIDGIADALGINDKRFDVPTYFCAEPERPGRVEVWIQ